MQTAPLRPRLVGRAAAGAVDLPAMRRRLFTLCSAFCLLLCVAVCALWARGRSRMDHLTFTAGGARLWWISSGGSGVSVMEVEGWPRQEPLEWRVYGDGSKMPWLSIGDRGWEGCAVIPNGPEVFTLLAPDGKPILWPSGTWGTESKATRPILSAPMACHRVAIPYRQTAAVLALPPAVVAAGVLVRRVRGRRRWQRGRCPACGYDLRAMPDRCPECGTVPDVTDSPTSVT